MLHLNTIDDVVMALAEAPVDSRTLNKTLYSVNWLADRASMIGQPSTDWIRRELDWFRSGSDRLADMEGPVPKLFTACAGDDPYGRVNSAYGHILFRPFYGAQSLYDTVVKTFVKEGLGSRHGVIIVSDRAVHELATAFGRQDFICTNALNIMINDDNSVHIIAQMRSMDAVFGYRADYSMWDLLMDMLVGELNAQGFGVARGNITFQVANLHVYPRHFKVLGETAIDTDERIQRRVWGGSVLNPRFSS